MLELGGYIWKRIVRQKSLLMFALSSLLFLSWVILIVNVRPVFLNIEGIDGLGMIHVLLPFFWVLILAYAVLGLVIFFLKIDSKFLHVWIIIQVSLVLYYTPFILSGYSLNPDSMWLINEANYMPSILSGNKVLFSTYAQTYPSSFVITRTILEVTGMNIFDFSRVYPIFTITLLTLLAYTFGSYLLKPRIAFLAMLLVLPAWHYMDYHASPHVTGALLLLTTLVLLTRLEASTSRVKVTSLVFLSTFAMILSHPVSPINLGIFAGVAYFSMLFLGKLTHTKLKPVLISFVFLLFLIVGWFDWIVNHVFPLDVTIQYAFRRVFTLRFSGTIVGRVQSFSVGGGSYIYPDIFRLSELVYISYLVIGFVFLFRAFVSYRFRRKALDLDSKTIVLFAASIGYVAFSYFLLLGTGDHHLLYRGLIPFILMISLFIGWHVVRLEKPGVTIVKIVALVYVVLLFASFPIVAYAFEAYNSFPYSEGVTMKFVTSHVDVSNTTVSMSGRQQLTPYLDLTKSLDMVRFSPNLTETQPGVIVVLRSAFYVYAMRYDLSFEQNRIVNLENQLANSTIYNLVYSNPTSEVYVTTP